MQGKTAREEERKRVSKKRKSKKREYPKGKRKKERTKRIERGGQRKRGGKGGKIKTKMNQKYNRTTSEKQHR